MDTFLEYFLPVYLVLFLGVAFVARSFIVWKRTGINAYALINKDGVEGIIARYFRLLPVLSLFVVGAFSFYPAVYQHLGVIQWLEGTLMDVVGLGLLVFSFIWITIAQSDMRDSWRIGIDEKHRTDLVIEGLFRYSRNPIFFGMVVNVIGLFIVLPNAVTLSIMLLSTAMIRLQIALEEDFLLRSHGESYREFQQRVRRWI